MGGVLSKESYFRRKLQSGRLLPSRDAAIIDSCRNKSVIHIGCSDSPFTKLRLSQGALLHQKLIPVTSRLLGVDIDSRGLDLLREEVGGDYSDINIANYNKDEVGTLQQVFGFAPDLVVLGDVVEHLEDPTQVLKALANLTRGSNTEILITTPNSLAVRNIINTALGYELMHPEHLLIHSPTTLRTVLDSSGLTPVAWDYYLIQTGTDLPHRLYDSLESVASKLRSAWADGHFVVCVSKDAR